MNYILLVSFGAVLGANARFVIYKKLENLNLSKIYIISFINTLASFFLGLILSGLSYVGSLKFSDQLGLFFLIGFLGSLSTFSTFIYDLFDLLLKFKFFSALKFFIISLASGIIALILGFLLFKL